MQWTAPGDCSTITLRSKNADDPVYKTVTGVNLTSSTSNVTITGLKGGLKYWFALIVVGGANEGTSNVVTAVPLESIPTPTVAPTVSPTVTGAPSVSPTAVPSVTVTGVPSVSPTSGGAGSGGGGGCSVGDTSFMAGVLLLLPLLFTGLKALTR